jgi:hypothetical protein
MVNQVGFLEVVFKFPLHEGYLSFLELVLGGR